MTDVSSLCLNCDQPLPAGPYCAHCGQQRPHRLSVGHVLHELVHVFTHADKSIFGYVALVLTRPGQVVRDYLTGRRKRYFNPFQFLLLAVGLATALVAVLHYYEGTSHRLQQQMQRIASPGQLVRIEKYFRFIGKYQNLWWLLLLLPVYALFVWLVFGRRRVNYAESFLVFVVVGAAYHILWIATLLSLWAFGPKQLGATNLAALIQIVTMLVYLTLIGWQGFRMSLPGALWRAALIVLLGAAFSAALNWLAFKWYVFG